MSRQIPGIIQTAGFDPGGPLLIQGTRPLSRSKSCFVLSHPAQAAGPETRSHIAGSGMSFLPELAPFAESGRLIYAHPNAKLPEHPARPRIHIIGLGDVGMHCALGLRLLGGADLTLGLYARDHTTAEALSMELNQCAPHTPVPMPRAVPVRKDQLLNCDALVFAASAGVPKTLKPGDDVRMMQFENNKKILSEYLSMLRSFEFSGTLFILSDPVDALCAFAAKELAGVLPRERILGLGLGVMAARAAYYADESAPEYLQEGRAYGPHGEGLWIANSIENYDDRRSETLTEKAKTANLAIRAKGQKPFYGPSIASGAWSLLHWVRGEWFYASIALDTVYFGCRVRRIGGLLQTEHRVVEKTLGARLDETIEQLRRYV